MAETKRQAKGGSIGSGTKGQRGLSESVQLAMIIPVIMLALFGVIQASIWFGARSAAQDAVLAGAEQGAILAGNSSDAYRVSSEIASQAGIVISRLEIKDDGRIIEVKLDGHVRSLLPGRFSQVSASAYRYKES